MSAASSLLPSSTEYPLLPSEVSEAKSSLKSKNRNKRNFTAIDIKTIRMNLFKATEKGCGHAFYLLGKISHIGIGIERDLAIAKLFYTQGKNLNDSASIRGLEKLLKYSDNGSEDYHNLINRAHQMENGFGCDINLIEARKLYKKAARLENCVHAAGKYILLSDKLDMRANIPIDIKLLERASMHGIKEASYALAIYYGSINDDDLGIDYLFVAAHQKEPKAMYRLGWLYGIGTELIPIDAISSMTWLKAAGDAGYAKAYVILGKIYQKNKSNCKDLEKAQEYFNKAKNLGYDISKINHGYLFELSISSSGDETSEPVENEDTDERMI